MPDASGAPQSFTQSFYDYSNGANLIARARTSTRSWIDGRRLNRGDFPCRLAIHSHTSSHAAREAGGSRVVWTADLLPNEAATSIEQMMQQGSTAMAPTLDALAQAR